MIAKIGKILIAGTALVLVLLFFVGLLSPQEFRGSVSRDVPESADRIYAWLIDLDTLPQRHPDTTSVTPGSTNEQGLPIWTEHHGSRSTSFQIIEMAPGEYVTIQTITSNFGLSGTWSYTLKPSEDAGSTKVTISEISKAYDIFSRIKFTLIGRKFLLKAEMKALENWAEEN